MSRNPSPGTFCRSGSTRGNFPVCVGFTPGTFRHVGDGSLLQTRRWEGEDKEEEEEGEEEEGQRWNWNVAPLGVCKVVWKTREENSSRL